jgi:hypothetical protein
MTIHWVEAECAGGWALGFCISEAKEGMVTAGRGRAVAHLGSTELNREVQNEEDESSPNNYRRT